MISKQIVKTKIIFRFEVDKYMILLYDEGARGNHLHEKPDSTNGVGITAPKYGSASNAGKTVHLAGQVTPGRNLPLFSFFPLCLGFSSYFPLNCPALATPCAPALNPCLMFPAVWGTRCCFRLCLTIGTLTQCGTVSQGTRHRKPRPASAGRFSF